MIPYFQALGERIELAWKAQNYDESVLPRLALDALSAAPPCENVKVEEIVSWAFSPLHEFQQPDQGSKLFGEPPVVLFQAPRFYIEALFWLSGTTDIHQHAFSGAFSVLAGSSVHSHWRFASDRWVNSRMLLGRLERLSTEILRPGDLRPIHSGDRLIHQLFHLEVPSVTIVIRTYQNRNDFPQYKYLLPGMAIDTESAGSLLTRRLMLLSGMAKAKSGSLRRYAEEAIGNSDLETLYYTLAHLTRIKIDADLMGELYDRARRRHGDETVDLVRRVCEGERRTRIVVAARARISDPNVRFLLALLMLMPDRASIFEVIRLELPDLDPLAAIEGWLTGISERVIGFDFNEVNRILFRSLVEGLNQEQLLQRLRDQYSPASLDKLLDHTRRLAQSDLFFALFSESPFQQMAELEAASL
jgi:hypothetical protein